MAGRTPKIYAWLRRRRVPTPLALVIMLVGLTVLFAARAGIIGISIARFSGDIGSYTVKLNCQVGDSSRGQKSGPGTSCSFSGSRANEVSPRFLT